MPFYRRRWMAMLSAVAAFIALLLAALPLGVSYGLHTWLLDNGGEYVRIDDIDVNLFTGRAAVRDLRVRAQGRDLLTIPSLVVDIDWLPLFSRQVALRSIAIDGVGLSIRQDAQGVVRVGGISLPADGEPATAAPPAQPWQVGVDRLHIVATTIEYQSPELAVTTRLDNLELSGIKTWATEPAPLAVRGAINGAALDLQGELPPLAEGFGYRGSIALDALDLGAFATVAAAAIDDLAGRLSTDMHVDVLLAPEQPLHVTQSGRVRVVGLALAQAANHVAMDSLQWDGELELTAGTTPRVTAGGRVVSAGLALDVDGTDVRLLRMAGLETGRVSLADDGAVAIADLAVQGVVFAQPLQEGAEPLLTAGAVGLDSLDLAAGTARAGRLGISDIVTRLRRDADGSWQVTRLFEKFRPATSVTAAESAQAGAAAEAAESTVRDAAAPPVPADAAPAGTGGAARISLAGLHIAGDSAIDMQDVSVQPAFSSRLVLREVEIGALDSAQPEQDTPVSIEGRTGKHSRISIRGTVRPFAARPTLELDNRLEGVALTDLSPYTVNMLGYELKSGHLDVESKLGIDHGSMDGKNRLTLRALDVAPVDNAARAQLESQLSVPLGTALNMLRDRHDTITLDLPVGGDIDSPDFDISDVVNTAVSKALKKASMTYLTVALQPYGALISVAKLAGEAASRVSLAPVDFGPGSTEQPAGSRDYLDKVASILGERPELNIKVCGVANETDRATLAARAAAARVGQPAEKAGEKADGKPVVPPPVEAVRISDEQLLELAVQRAAVVTDYLVEQHAVSAGRLVACQPSMDSSPAGKGRVDLLL